MLLPMNSSLIIANAGWRAIDSCLGFWKLWLPRACPETAQKLNIGQPFLFFKNFPAKFHCHLSIFWYSILLYWVFQFRHMFTLIILLLFGSCIIHLVQSEWCSLARDNETPRAWNTKITEIVLLQHYLIKLHRYINLILPFWHVLVH